MPIAASSPVTAACSLPASWEWPRCLRSSLAISPAQRRAYVLADNRLALSAGWDEDLLRIELGDLQVDGFDLALTGFDADEIAGFLADPITGLTDPDDVPAAPDTPTSRLGDVWLLGRHRLVCGDSTDAATVERVLNGVRPHLIKRHQEPIQGRH